jgi:hypothetical protein
MNENEEIPLEVILKAEEASLNWIPSTSREVYDKEYKHFHDWREKRGVSTKIAIAKRLKGQ